MIRIINKSVNKYKQTRNTTQHSQQSTYKIHFIHVKFQNGSVSLHKFQINKIFVTYTILNKNAEDICIT